MKSDVRMKRFMEAERKQINKRLPVFIEGLKAPMRLKEAMLYSLNAGGKRIRPMLLLATLKGFRQPLSLGYDVACAIEMIHTYSLIHDDLPAMDDDDLRRGEPTNHIVFGEAVAVLAGDGLLTQSFHLLASLKDTPDHIKILLIQRLAEAAGPVGMVGGQVADMEGEGVQLDVNKLQEIHHRKTGDLLSVSLECGAILSSATPKDIQELRSFGKHLGLAFQIKDDLLDVEGDEKKLGKRVGSDELNEKNTYPKILGLEKAREKLYYHITEAKEHLKQTSMETEILDELANYISTRSN